MSALAVPVRRPVLADALAPHRTRLRDAGLVLAGAGVVALLAQVTIPLPIVPITGQTLGVILVGASLGSRRGAAALLTYLLVGLAGAPVFAEFTGGPAAVLLPSFGFLLGFVPAAFVAGWFAERAWDRRPLLALVGFVAASVVPFLVGVPYLAMILNAVMGAQLGLVGILEVGVLPFIVGGLVKAAIAAVLIPAAWRGVRALDERR
ncbi:biotin transporter BioY [Brachybacterium sp. YJGR34]|uniref:biotin transporter BioY n=1 Tax=Brachybacterium sp. YJGR34 TaxID=2059911 RepID=UPI000E0CB4B9|nr:biotin transporter BioY [Brachybacterium sp. YJGR34]